MCLTFTLPDLTRIQVSECFSPHSPASTDALHSFKKQACQIIYV
ncbi:hypothetical protein [Prevotella intermedia]|nr:hypothetical protein [Prevotella intermedia]